MVRILEIIAHACFIPNGLSRILTVVYVSVTHKVTDYTRVDGFVKGHP